MKLQRVRTLNLWICRPSGNNVPEKKLSYMTTASSSILSATSRPAVSRSWWFPPPLRRPQVLALNPDGIVLSNGPGDPAAVTYAVDNVRQVLGKKPVFGICLGHQLMGLALGGRTFKLKFGHRGGNQPVKNLLNGRVEITSQNHGFAVDLNSISDPSVELTHFNLNDNTLEGLRHLKLRAFSVQYHPEASPGPHDADYLFDEFLKSELKLEIYAIPVCL